MQLSIMVIVETGAEAIVFSTHNELPPAKEFIDPVPCLDASKDLFSGRIRSTLSDIRVFKVRNSRL